MVRKDLSKLAATRRNVLSAFAGGGVSAVLASLSSTPARAAAENSTVLGDFESNLNGWTTNGGNRLSRIHRSERPGVVTQGENALNVSVNGDPFPMISNRKRVKGADFVQNPYLLADVSPGRIDDTDSSVSFRFRLHHSAGAKNDRGEGGDGNGGSQKSALIEESETRTVRQASVSQLYWDMSDVDDRKLDTTKRLDVVWYPTDHEPKGGPNGRGAGFAYHGNVVFDNIRITDTVDDVASAQIASTMEELEFAHGPYVRTEVTSESDTLEEGEFVFSDETTEPYRFEILAEDKFLFTIAGTDVKLGGGWE